MAKLRNSNYCWWRYIGLTIGVLTIIATRWLYHAHYLYHWDSVQFALAINNFDLSAHQPHPPGYILYVGIAKLLNYFVHDTNLALIILGIIASVIGFLLVYQLGREAFGELVGWLVGVWFIFNSSIWFHGLVAEVYIVETAVVVGLFLAAFRHFHRPTNTTLIWLLIASALLGGIRQFSAILTLPLVTFVFLHSQDWKRQINWALPLWVGLNLLWAIPLVVASGGLGQYFTLNWQLTRLISVDSSNPITLKAVLDRLSFAITLLRSAFLPLLALLGLGALPFIVRESKQYLKISWSWVWFWLLTIVPGLLFIIIVWLTNNGYILFITPVLLVLAGAGTLAIAKIAANFSRIYGYLVIGAALVTVLTFQVYQFYTLNPDAYDYLSAGLPSVQTIDRGSAETAKLIREKFTPDNTIIIASNRYIFFGLRHHQFYYPDFDVYSLVPQAFLSTSPIWHVRGGEVHEFLDNITLSPNIKYILRAPGYNLLGTDSVQHEIFLYSFLPQIDWAYYDLSDDATVHWLKNNREIKFIFNSTSAS